MTLEPDGAHEWHRVERGPRRVLPALPETDADLGEIRWERWERALQLSHIDPSCHTCGYEGPLATARGMTLHQDRPRRTLLRRSAIAQGRRPMWGPVFTPQPRWVYTHWASRCQACDEMTVWIMSGQRPRCDECAAVSPVRLTGQRAQCPTCLREAGHEVPGGVGRAGTWIEIAYHPPTTEQVPPGGQAPQQDALF